MIRLIFLLDGDADFSTLQIIRSPYCFAGSKPNRPDEKLHAGCGGATPDWWWAWNWSTLCLHRRFTVNILRINSREVPNAKKLHLWSRHKTCPGLYTIQAPCFLTAKIEACSMLWPQVWLVSVWYVYEVDPHHIHYTELITACLKTIPGSWHQPPLLNDTHREFFYLRVRIRQKMGCHLGPVFFVNQQTYRHKIQGFSSQYRHGQRLNLGL